MPAVRVAECETADDVWRAARKSEARRKAWNAPRPPKEPEPAVIHNPREELMLMRWMGRPAVEIWREMLTGRRRVRVDEQSLDDAFPRPLVEDVIRAVARAYGFRSTDLKAARRDARVVRARHVAMLLCKLLTLRSFPKIARCFGNRDHTTVLHASRKLAWLAPQLEALHTLSDPASAWAATAARLYPVPEEVAE